MPNGRSSIYDIIDPYKKDVGLSLVNENLKPTLDERLQKLQKMTSFAAEARNAGEAAIPMKQSKASAPTDEKLRDANDTGE